MRTFGFILCVFFAATLMGALSMGLVIALLTAGMDAVDLGAAMGTALVAAAAFGIFFAALAAWLLKLRSIPAFDTWPVALRSLVAFAGWGLAALAVLKLGQLVLAPAASVPALLLAAALILSAIAGASAAALEIRAKLL